MRSVKLMFLFVCRALGLFRLSRRLVRDRLRILCYHGFALADEARFRPKLFMSGNRFAQRLQVIRRLGLKVLPLDEAVERLYAGSLPHHAVVITVDDGFHAVSTVAAPQLREHGFPATVYVTTYYVENEAPVFRLAVQYMFWKAGPRRLTLDGLPWAADGVVDLADPAQADRALWACIRHGETQCSEAQRHDICRRLGELLGTPYDEIVRSRMLHLMTPSQLRTLAASGADVQLHTHRYRFPVDDREQAQREIADNRRALGQWIDGERRHFCYPSGLFDPRQFEWLDALGVRSSTTCLPGLNSAATPRHALRRFLDGENIHWLEFEAAVSGFSDLLRRLRPQVQD